MFCTNDNFVIKIFYAAVKSGLTSKVGLVFYEFYKVFRKLSCWEYVMCSVEFYYLFLWRLNHYAPGKFYYIKKLGLLFCKEFRVYTNI